MNVDIDWNDPKARFHLAERLGPDEYNKAVNAYIDTNPIRMVQSRYGTLYAVARTGRAFSTLEQARAFLSQIADGTAV